MKKLFSKKSGFSLVEIVIAFAIFGLFASMIAQVISLSVNRRKENDKFADYVQQQELDLITKAKKTAYDPDKASGDKLKLSFDGLDDLSIAYMTVDAEGNAGETGGLNYFIGEIEKQDDAASSSEGTTPDPGSEKDAGGSTQASRFDTRITGTKGINYIQVLSMTTSISGSYYSYEFEVTADGTTVQKDNKPYTQFTLFFPSDYNITYLQVMNSGGYDVRKSGANGVRVNVGKNTTGGQMTTGNRVKFKVELNKPLPSDFTVSSFSENNTLGIYKAYESGGEKYDNLYGAYPKS